MGDKLACSRPRDSACQGSRRTRTHVSRHTRCPLIHARRTAVGLRLTWCRNSAARWLTGGSRGIVRGGQALTLKEGLTVSRQIGPGQLWRSRRREENWTRALCLRQRRWEGCVCGGGGRRGPRTSSSVESVKIGATLVRQPETWFWMGPPRSDGL